MEDEVTVGHLERHLPVQLRISRLIELSHSALTDESSHVVVPEARHEP